MRRRLQTRCVGFLHDGAASSSPRILAQAQHNTLAVRVEGERFSASGRVPYAGQHQIVESDVAGPDELGVAEAFRVVDVAR